MHTWLSSCFMQDDQVGNVVGFAGSHQRSDLMVSPVHALGSREHQLYLLWQHRLDHIITLNLNSQWLTSYYLLTVPAAAKH